MATSLRTAPPGRHCLPAAPLIGAHISSSEGTRRSSVCQPPRRRRPPPLPPPRAAGSGSGLPGSGGLPSSVPAVVDEGRRQDVQQPPLPLQRQERGSPCGWLLQPTGRLLAATVAAGSLALCRGGLTAAHAQPQGLGPGGIPHRSAAAAPSGAAAARRGGAVGPAAGATSGTSGAHPGAAASARCAASQASAFASVSVGSGGSPIIKAASLADVAGHKLAGLLQQVLSAHIGLKVCCGCAWCAWFGHGDEGMLAAPSLPLPLMQPCLALLEKIALPSFPLPSPPPDRGAGGGGRARHLGAGPAVQLHHGGAPERGMLQNLHRDRAHAGCAWCKWNGRQAASRKATGGMQGAPTGPAAPCTLLFPRRRARDGRDLPARHAARQRRLCAARLLVCRQ